MPGQIVHTTAGAAIGATYASYRARTQTESNRLVEAVGGAIGGGLGGRLPDILEPADSPNHRSLFHSLLAGGAGLAVKLEEAEDFCRNQATENREWYTARTAAGDPLAFMYWLAELFWRLAAGFLNGIKAGYLSHLVLDAFTPQSLPVLG